MVISLSIGSLYLVIGSPVFNISWNVSTECLGIFFQIYVGDPMQHEHIQFELINHFNY